MEKKKILFFIADFVPTKEEREEAEKLGTKMFRSARMVVKTSPIEKCDGVAGCVPDAYLKFAEPASESPKEPETKPASVFVGKKEDEKPKMAPKKVAWTPNN